MTMKEQQKLTRQHWVMPAGGGSLTDMKLEQGDISPPGYGELCVRVQAIGLNFADVFTALGLYSPIRSGELEGRLVPGIEFAGVVERVGDVKDQRLPDSVKGEDQMKRGGQMVLLSEEVWKLAEGQSHKFAVGDRVMGCARFGAYSTKINVPAHQVVKIPESWSVQQGAAFTAQTLTAYYALKALGAAESGKTVLIHSAAGGCGLQAMQICHKLGVHVIGTVGSEDKVSVLLELFPSLCKEQIIVRKSTKQEFHKQLEGAISFLKSSRGSRGLDIVLDAVLGIYFDPGFQLMAPGGRYVVYGAASMTPTSDGLGWMEWMKLAWQWLWRPKVDPLELPSQNKSLMGFNLIHCLNDASTLLSLMDSLMALDLPPPHVGLQFKFHEVVEALRLFRSGRTTGKVVLNV